MGKIIIINASPRAPKSNSRQYAQLFTQACPMETEYCNLSKTNHLELCGKLEEASHVLFVFPLYADGIPVTLLNFLKTLEEHPPRQKPVMSVMMNCGFIEPEQNEVAVKMMRFYAGQNGYLFGSVLKIGSGEAILTTPFQFLVRAKVKKLADCIVRGQQREMQVTMPLPKKVFIRASTKYWIRYGQKNGVTKAEMETMKIEGQLP